MGNSSNSYATLKPLEGSVVDLLTNFENQDNILRREAMIRAANKANVEQQAKAERNRRLEGVKYPVLAASGVQTADDFKSRAINLNVEEINNAKIEIANPNTTELRREELYNKIAVLNKAPETFLSAEGELTRINTEYNTGKYHTNTSLETFRTNGASGWNPFYDKKGNLVVAFMDKDVNEDGVIDKLDVVSYADLQSHSGIFKLNLKYDKAQLLKTDSDILGQKDTTLDNSYQSVRTLKTPADRAAAIANSRIIGAGGELTPEGTSLAITYGIPLTVKNEKDEEVPNTAGFDALAKRYATELINTKNDLYAENNHPQNTGGGSGDGKVPAATANDHFSPDYKVIAKSGWNNGGYRYEHKEGDKLFPIRNGEAINVDGKINPSVTLTEVSKNLDGSWTLFVENRKLLETGMTPDAQARYSRGELLAADVKGSDFIGGVSPYATYTTGSKMGSSQALKVVTQLKNEQGQYYKSFNEFIQDLLKTARGTAPTAEELVKKYGNK